MGLFSKKEDVPTIPPAPTLPTLPKLEESEKKDLPELPSFPANSKNENLNQEMVKSAVADLPNPEENEVHVEIPEGLNVKEEEKGESIMVPPKPSPNEVIPHLPKKTLEIHHQHQQHQNQKLEKPNQSSYESTNFNQPKKTSTK